MLFTFFRKIHYSFPSLKTKLKRIHDPVGVQCLLQAFKYLHGRAVLFLHKASQLDTYAVMIVDNAAMC